jgi:hypothetical protein
MTMPSAREKVVLLEGIDRAESERRLEDALMTGRPVVGREAP